MTRHKLFATWKNQVNLAQSLILADGSVQEAAPTEGLFELSACPSMTALASVAQATAGKVALTAQNMGWDDTHSLTGETPASDLIEIGRRYVTVGECKPDEAVARHSFIRSVIATELGAAVAADTTLLYGGVTASNAEGYFTPTGIDRELVGGASQQPTRFQALIKAAIATYSRQRPGADH